ncbi:MAG TPA: metallophosphoesterase, partial [Micromonosporaceae bacterium]|nr:metallophosphoesterase [Micromonosporaceae bacterium]
MDTDVVGRYRPALEKLPDQAEVLLLAGDLTRHGTESEARCVAQEFGGLDVPVIAVLGNHDYHSDRAPQVTKV